MKTLLAGCIQTTDKHRFVVFVRACCDDSLLYFCTSDRSTASTNCKMFGSDTSQAHSTLQFHRTMCVIKHGEARGGDCNGDGDEATVLCDKQS